MSLNSALNASVSGLRAQSASLAALSENIANASTTAYKTREVDFQSLVTSTNVASSANQIGGAVTFTSNQNLTKQGSIEITGKTENLAIQGQGFFVVSDDPTNQPSAYQYSRNGNFSTNANGLLVNDEGMLLLGQRTDDDGEVTAANRNDLNSLEPIDLNSISGTAQATGNVEFDLNLPADAPIASTYQTAFEVFDQLGVSHTVEQTWTKLAANSWTVDYDNPYQTSLGPTSPSTGAIDVDSVAAGSQTLLAIVFNGNGSINTINGLAADLFDVSITGFTTGSTPITFETDFGRQNLFEGLTQYSSNTDVPGIDISLIEQDGVRFGQFSGVSIDSEGLVTAAFDNGVRLPIFRVPIATFPNPNGLTNVRGTIYDENENAGNYNLRSPGEGNAGTISATSLEVSTTDTSEEFNKMIVSQQAYSAAAQVLSTVNEMFDTLIGSVR